MKKIFCCLLSLLPMAEMLCQTETFDIISYSPPKDWKKEIKQGVVLYTNVNTTTGGFCVIALYASALSSGDAEKDFQSEWKDLVLTTYKGEANPKTESETSAEGWVIIGGASPVQMDSLQFYAVLTVYSGFGKKLSVVTTLNDKAYLTDVDALLRNIKLDKTASVSNPISQSIKNSADNSIFGTWSNTAVSIANYVNPSGVFVGSADVSTMEEYTFKTNNTYVSKFFGSAKGKLYYTESAGTFKLNGRNLTLTPLKRRGGYSGNIHDEKDLLDKPSKFDCYIGPNKWEAGPFLNLHKDGNYYMYSDYPYDYYKKISDSNKSETKDSPDKNKTPMNETAVLQTNQFSGATGKFGSLIYNIPKGWSVTKYPDGDILIPADLPKDEFLEIWVQPSMNFSGTMEQALQKSYDETVVNMKATKMHDVNGGDYNKETAKISFRGWEYIRCSGGIHMGGGEYPSEYGLELFVVKINNRFERIAVVQSRKNCGLSRYLPSDRRNYNKEIQNFLFSPQFADWKDAEAKPGIAKGDGIVGVWEGITMLVGMAKPGASLGAELKGTDAIFFSNGQAYFGTKSPVDGLDELNTRIEAELNRRNWGTCTFTNGKGVLKMPYGDILLRMEKGKLIVTKTNTEHAFINIPAVDGAKFNGTYVFSSKDFTGQETGKTPTINFTGDGKFTDNGAVSVIYHEYVDCLNPTKVPGSGSYEVKNHSVIFNYGDGRKIKIAFVGLEYDKKNQSPASITLSYNEDTMVRK